MITIPNIVQIPLSLALAFSLVFGAPALAFAEDGTEGGDGTSTSASTDSSNASSSASDESQSSATDTQSGSGSDGVSTPPADIQSPEDSNDGQSGGENPDAPPTVIETGDATATLDTENVANTNNTTTEAQGGNNGGTTETSESSDSEGNQESSITTENPDGSTTTTTTTTDTDESGGAHGGTESTTTETTTETTYPESSEPNTTSTVLGENNATSTGSAAVNAETGSNEGEGAGDVTVHTGDAFSFANLVNVINTNIVNSNGAMLLLNALLGMSNFDLRQFADIFINPGNVATTGGCSLESCDSGDVALNVLTQNTVSIVNDIIVRALTGSNSAISGSGNALIETGNAYAGANLMNVANTNIVNSNYLLLSFNNIGDFFGDIVLPSSTFFHDVFFTGGLDTPNTTNIANTNTADIGNNVGVGADSGVNNAESASSTAAVNSGNAQATANIANFVNQNMIGGESFFMLIRVAGEWSGDIFGLPEGISWMETPQGIMLYGNGAPGGGLSGGMPLSTLSVANTSTASIANNVSVYALTGDNYAEGQNGATINTGNAYANANVVNVVNTNVVGRNWIMAVLNIMGDWSGNLSFGMPDLWIGGRIESDTSPVLPTGRATYTFTVANRGDSDATNVMLKHTFNKEWLSFGSSGTDLSDGVLWNLGTIKKGEVVEVTYNAFVGGPSMFQYGEILVPSTATVSAAETDANTDDNTEVLSVAVRNPDPQSGGPVTTYLPDPVFEITKTHNKPFGIQPGESAHFTVRIRNVGGPAYQGILVDTVYDSLGEAVNEQVWELSTIQSNEEITVTYDVQFASTTVPDIYTNYAQVRAIGRSPSLNPFLGSFAVSPIASSTLAVLNADNTMPASRVSLEDGIACGPYLLQYMKFGKTNDPVEVEKLQRFLNEFEGTSLSVNGVFNLETETTVKRFQEKYASDILTPWGHDIGTGYVYYTTQKKINELYCKGAIAFPLSPEQQAEVQSFKALLLRLKRAGYPIPTEAGGEVGILPNTNTPLAKKDEEDQPEVPLVDYDGIDESESDAHSEDDLDLSVPSHSMVGGAGESVSQLREETRSMIRGLMNRMGRFLLHIVGTGDDVSMR